MDSDNNSSWHNYDIKNGENKNEIPTVKSQSMVGILTYKGLS